MEPRFIHTPKHLKISSKYGRNNIKELYKKALNRLIQGSGRSNKTGNSCYEAGYLPKYKCDELCFDIKNDKDIKTIKTMENCMEFKVPSKVDSIRR